MRQCMGCMEEYEELQGTCPYCGYVKGTPPKEAYHMSPETILEGRYIVGRVLGYGGFGVTYIGYDAQLMRKVAIKEFLPSSFATRMPGYTEITVYGGEATLQFEAGLSRFTEEAKRLAGFNSVPGIVDIYDTFVENNTAYIVMQYLKGKDVKGMLAEKGVYTFEEALPIILSICDTLEPVHQAGIIHRDIAPDNIYITVEGEVKLLDFGASRFATSVNSKSLSVILKSGYAPEEQYRSKGEQGAWSDVYALAATFYKMITGVTPEDSMERAIKDELKEPSKLGAVLPESAENAIMNALNIRKENRMQSAGTFREALTEGKVARIKEKAVRSDSGKLPLWGKLLIGASLGFVLLFGLLTVTGVVDLGQGNLLADTFGSGVPDGYVNAPGIVNQLEQKAQKLVKKANLDYLIVGTEYSDDIEKGKILSQEPLPGRLIEVKGELQVVVSGGSRGDALAAGDMVLPDLTYMTVAQAVYESDQVGFVTRINYDYSDTVAEGLVISYEESYQLAELTVSVGKDDGDQEYGALRAPCITVDYSGEPVVNFAVASAHNRENRNLDSSEYIRHQFYYSVDEGKTWEPVQDENQWTASNMDYRYNTHEHELVPTGTLDIAGYINHKFPELSGKEIMLKLERWKTEEFSQRNQYNPDLEKLNAVLEELKASLEAQGIAYDDLEDSEIADLLRAMGYDAREYDIEAGGGIRPIDSYILEQKVTVSIEGEAPKVDSIRKLTLEDIEKILNKNPDLKEHSSLGNAYNNYMEEPGRDMPIVHEVKGNFKQSERYRVMSDVNDELTYNSGERYCEVDGILYVVYGREEEWTKGLYSLTTRKLGETEVSEGGHFITRTTPASQTLWVDGEKAVVTEERQGKIIQSPRLARETYGGIRIAFLVEQSAVPTLENSYMNCKIAWSVDGGKTWLNEEDNTYGMNEKTDRVQTVSFPIQEYAKENPQTEGKEIKIRMTATTWGEEGDQILDRCVLEQTLRWNTYKGNFSVKGYQQLSTEEVGKKITAGEITKENNSNTYHSYQNQMYDPNAPTEFYFFQYQGNFEKGVTYDVKMDWGEGNGYSMKSIVCEKAGELLLSMHKSEFDNKIQSMSIGVFDLSFDEQKNAIVQLSEPISVTPVENKNP